MTLCRVKIEDVVKCAECNEFKGITRWNVALGIYEIQCSTIVPCKFQFPIKEG